MKSTISFILFLVSISCLGQAKTITNEEASKYFLKVSAAYTEVSSISMDVNHTFYNGYFDSIPYASVDGFYMKKEKMEHSKLLGIETIQNQSVRVVIDSANRIILAGKPLLYPKNDPASIIQTLSVCRKITLKSSESTLSFTFLFNIKNPDFSSMVINVDPERFFIQSIVIYHPEERDEDDKTNKPGRTVIEYRNIKRNPGLQDKNFSVKKVLLTKGNKYSLSSDYSAYTLHQDILQ